jgi:hypothetical protein
MSANEKGVWVGVMFLAAFCALGDFWIPAAIAIGVFGLRAVFIRT